MKKKGDPMKCLKNLSMIQKENTKPIDINTNTRCLTRPEGRSRYSCFPMKKCLLSQGSTRDVQQKKGVSNGNCVNKTINTNNYIIGQIFRFFKRAEFPMPLYNILEALDMSNVGMVIPYIFLRRAHRKKSKWNLHQKWNNGSKPGCGIRKSKMAPSP